MTATPAGLTDAQRALLARMSAPPGEREGLYPATASQRSLWFLDQRAPGGTAYHMPALLRMHGTLDCDRLASALQRVVDRHEALRTTFVSVDGRPLQRVVARRRHHMSIVDATGRNVDGVIAEAVAAAYAPFDLREGPLVRSVLWRRAEDDHLLLLAVHHIVADGWSVGLMLSDLAAAMEDHPTAGQPSGAAQPVDLALREAASAQDGDAMRFWAAAVAGAESPRLPARAGEPPAERCGTVRLPLPDSVVAAVRDLASRQRTTDRTVYLTALATLCHRMTGQTDVAIGVPFARRNTSDTQRTVGFLVNTLPVRIAWQGEMTFAELTAICARAVRDAMAHDDVPFATVVEHTGEGTASLVDVMLVVNPELLAGGRLGGLQVELVPLAPRAAKVPLTVSVDLGARGTSLNCEYDPSRFDEDVVSSLARSLRTLLVRVTSTPETRIAAIPLLDPAGAEERLALGRGPRIPDVLAGAGLGETVAGIADDDPDRPALVERDRRITYGELLTTADRLARVLRSRSTEQALANRPVGVYLPRGIDQAVACLAVVRAGGHYLPLDPAHPPERNWSLLAESDPCLLLTAAELYRRLGSAGVESILLDRLPEPTPDGGTGLPVGWPDQLAAVVQPAQASRPAGVLITHRSAARFAGRPDRVYLHAGPVASDAGLRELWGTLLAGARGVIVAPDDLRPGSVTAAVREHGVTTARLTTRMFRALDRDQRRALARLSELEIGGQAPPASHIRTGVHVLDAMLRPVPVGALGDVYLDGQGVAVGYVNRPGLTADRFVPSPFGVGERLFRTGERAYARADGPPVPLGGPTGAEAVLARHPAVADAVVVTHADTGLVAYLVPDGGEPEHGELRDLLGANAPDAFVTLDQMPLDGNGELDPARLPDPVWDRTPVPPATALERRLAEAWADLLGVDVATISRSDSFFRLGGHSLLATRLIARLSVELSRPVPLQMVFDHPTLSSAAEALSRLGGERDMRPPVASLADGESVPLSFAQRRLWFLHQFDPTSPQFNLPLAVRLRGPLDVRALHGALQLLTDRHETLRTTFVPDSDPPRARLLPDRGIPMTVVDFAELTAADDHAARVLRQAAVAPFDLVNDPPIRAVLVRTAAADHVLQVVVHHIACDGWSIGVLARDLSVAYSALRAGRAPQLPELSMRYGDFAAWQRDLLSGGLLDEEFAHWSGVLAGAPQALDLPTDHPRPPVFRRRGGTTPVCLGAAGTAVVRRVAATHDATPFMVLLAALAVVLHRYTGQEDILVGTPVAGRSRPELENMVGCFIDVVPLRVDLSGGPSVGELLARVRRACVDAYAHPDLPFERLVEHLAPDRDPSRTPIFQVMLALESGSPPVPDLSGVTTVPYPIDTGTTQHDLTFWLRDQPTGISGNVDYNRDIFERESVSRLVERVGSVAAWLAEAGSATAISDVDFATAAELSWLAEAGSGPRVPVTAGSVADAVLTSRPAGRVAVTDGRDPARSLSYGDLEGLAHEIAAALVARGVRRGDVVGVLLPRSATMVPVLLGVWLAGAAYVPLDPEFPVQRLRFMVADSGMRVMVSSTTAADRLPGSGVEVVLVDELVTGDRSAAVVHRPAVGGADRAYVMYTSGSTGRPKGVVVSHAAVLNLLSSMVAAPGITDTDRFLAVTTLSFDISVLELFGPLVAGARLVVASADQSADAVLLAELIESSGATVMQATPSTWRMLLDSGWRATRPLRVWCGGEPLPADLAAALLAAGHTLHNMYGPTETTIWSTVDKVSDAGRIGLGRPIANTDVHVLDSRFRPAAVGMLGELFIGGTGLADGYLDRPGLTAERFVPSPFGTGERLYRTGDLARFSYDGQLLFAGRADQQVKLRGHRIELGEIETHLATHPAVTEAVVTVHGDRLVAYLVTDREAPSTAEIRNYLRAWVPEYMIPSAVCALDSIPRTLNGKTDRGALPAPAVQSGSVNRVTPSTLLEGDVLAVWAEMLGVDADRLSMLDNFFDLGGHSMLAMRVAGRLSRNLRRRVSLRLLFEHPTAAGLARALSPGSDGEDLRPPLVVEHREVVPLAYAQRRLWFIYRLEGPSPTYNIPFALRLSGPLDRVALAAALDDVVGRQESLRTVFPEVEGAPRQVVLDPAEVSQVLRVVETSADRLAADLACAARHGFDLATEIPVRAWLFGVRPEENVLLLLLHHIAGDESSLRPFADDLALAYAARCRGEDPSWPALPVQYADYATWQRRVLGSPECPDSLLSQLRGYWTDTLKDLPEQLELPVDHKRPTAASYRGDVTDFTIGGELLAALRDVGRRHGASVFMVLQAAVAALLTRLGAGTDIPMGVPVGERTEEKLNDLVGLFVNVVVLRADTSGDPSFSALVSRVRDAGLAAYEHSELPFDHLVEALNPARSLSRHPLFQVVTAYQNAAPFTLDLPGLAVGVEPVQIDTAKFDLGFVFTERPGDQIDGMLVYATDLFEAGTARAMVARLIRMLERVLADPGVRIGDVDILCDVERHKLLVEWNDTASPAGKACWPELFEATVARFAGATAIVCGHRALTYAHLNAAANRVAHLLIEHGAGPERLVGLSLPRSIDAVIAVIAVLKSGAAYLPLDPDLPAARMRFMLDDAKPALVLTNSETAATLPATTKVVLLDDLARRYRDTDPCPSPPLSPASPAYVIYTSGSTGVPKGVVVSHTGVASLVETSLDRFDFDHNGRVLQFASISFDVAFWELSMALLTGARLVVAPAEQRVPGAPLAAYAAEHGVTHLGLPPSVLAAFPDDCALPPDATLVTGTERVPAEVVARFGRGRRLFNAYGPTEATVNSTLWEAPAGWNSDPVPIGRPDPGTRAYVLDPALRLAPPGVVGELYIAGPGLARGYLNRPGATAERFLANPFAEPGGRMYRTGDLARWNRDGNLEFAGRVDDQVKIRGFRVELGEIEAALGRHPAVREAVVVPRDDRAGGLRLVAYVVTEPGREAEPAELRRHVAAILPHYMVPSAFAVLESLPRGVHGKVDKARLPEPAAARADVRHPPTTSTERAVAAAVCEVLGLDGIGLYDDLFELGGHSLQLPRIAASIAERTGQEIPLREIFLDPTVAGMTRALSRAGTPAPPAIVRVDRRARARPARPLESSGGTPR